jgi:hypothetical protein
VHNKCKLYWNINKYISNIGIGLARACFHIGLLLVSGVSFLTNKQDKEVSLRVNLKGVSLEILTKEDNKLRAY